MIVPGGGASVGNPNTVAKKVQNASFFIQTSGDNLAVGREVMCDCARTQSYEVSICIARFVHTHVPDTHLSMKLQSSSTFWYVVRHDVGGRKIPLLSAQGKQLDSRIRLLHVI